MNSNGKMIKGKKSEWLIQAGEELAVSKRAQDDAFRAQQKTGKKKRAGTGSQQTHILHFRETHKITDPPSLPGVTFLIERDKGYIEVYFGFFSVPNVIAMSKLFDLTENL